MIPGRPARGRFAAPGPLGGVSPPPARSGAFRRPRPGEGRLNAPLPSPVRLSKKTLRVGQSGQSGQSRGGKIALFPPGRVGEAAHTRIPAKALRIRNKSDRGLVQKSEKSH